MTVDDVRTRARGDRRARRRRAPRGDEPLPRAARGLSRARRRARAGRRRDDRLERSTVSSPSEPSTTSATASASSTGREVRVRDREHAHPGCLRRADAVVRVLDRRATLSGRRRAGAPPRGRRRAPACRARPPRDETASRTTSREPRRAQHDLDQLGVRRRGDRDRPPLGDRAHDVGGAVGISGGASP